jgi:segregation and condensation protein B
MTEGAGRDSKVGEAEPTAVEAAVEASPAADEATPGETAPEPGGDALPAEGSPPADGGSPTAGLRAELGGDAAGSEAPSPADAEAVGVAEEPPSPDEGPAGEERRSKGPAPARVEYDDATLTQYVEALLFVSSHPLTVAQIARPLRTTFAAVRRAFQAIGERYAVRGIRLMEVGGGYQFRTAPECADVIRRFLDVRPLRLSKAAMETLAVVAYRQPVTKPDVDDIRGVDSGSAVKLLLDRNLVRVLGRKEEPGRPLLYGTTQAFLEFFNLSNLIDLPSLREYAELTEDGRRQLERDLFARSPDALSLFGDDGSRGRSARHWEDLVEVLGADLGGLPEGVEIEVEPSDPLAAYVQDTTFPRPSPEEPGGELDEGGPDDDDARLAGGGVLDGEAPAAAPEEPADDDGAEDAPDDEDDRP